MLEAGVEVVWAVQSLAIASSDIAVERTRGRRCGVAERCFRSGVSQDRGSCYRPR